jgi:2-polyprenyl-3-methyl-5-hydroxy-6-metoxy-1,4-benzoquinol methylase
VTDLDSYPRDEGPYDTVICLNVIEHVKDDPAALLNIKSVMAPDGKAIVLVPAVFRVIDRLLPVPSLSLIAVLARQPTPKAALPQQHLAPAAG